MPHEVQHIHSISQLHELRGLKPPAHPLISLVDYAEIEHFAEHNHIHWVHSFYSIAIKRNVDGKFRYGQKDYDFDEGLMTFIAPGQLLNVVVDENSKNERSGWILFVHPDFLWNSSLGTHMVNYEFFEYSNSEALFLSPKEEATIQSLFVHMRDELKENMDDFSRDIVISHIELLLNYCERFYYRQFLTRKKENHQILEQVESYLNSYFQQQPTAESGIPKVRDLADHLHLSPSYLSSVLKSLTGQNAQQHIHEKLIDVAKAELSTTSLSISEIAYKLGFEHVQSFSKLFKQKTKESPVEFRKRF